ncbi:MAG: T9SS type A sorting domain-containing protein, partial [Bacteroidales bacterium]
VGNEDGWYQVAEFDNADGSFDWTSNHLDITGSAFGQIFRVRFVAEGVNSTDVQSWFVDNIEVYRTCSGPNNLEIEQEDCVDLNLSWNSPYVCGGGSGPGPGPGEWLAWDDGENTGGIGLTGGGVFSVASHWDPDMLTAYDGMSITKIRFVPFENAASTTFTLMVWEGANAGTLLYEEDLDNLLLGEWNEIELQTAIPIDVTKELWFGYTVDSPDGENPAGHDAGPAVAGYGDMITLDGVAWDPLSSFGPQFDVNWNLQAYVESTDGEATALTPLVDRTEYTTPNAELSAEKGEGIVAVPAGNANRELQGYNIHLNGEFLDFTADTTYLYTVDSNDTYTFDVVAVYEDCESDTAATESIEVVCVGINELLGEDNIAIYPNPATDVLNVVASDDITFVTVMNNVGQVVYNSKVVEENTLEITTTGFEAGVYMIKVETADDVMIKKVIIAQ